MFWRTMRQDVGQPSHDDRESPIAEAPQSIHARASDEKLLERHPREGERCSGHGSHSTVRVEQLLGARHGDRHVEVRG